MASTYTVTSTLVGGTGNGTIMPAVGAKAGDILLSAIIASTSGSNPPVGTNITGSFCIIVPDDDTVAIRGGNAGVGQKASDSNSDEISNCSSSQTVTFTFLPRD